MNGEFHTFAKAHGRDRCPMLNRQRLRPPLQLGATSRGRSWATSYLRTIEPGGAMLALRSATDVKVAPVGAILSTASALPVLIAGAPEHPNALIWMVARLARPPNELLSVHVYVSGPSLQLEHGRSPYGSRVTYLWPRRRCGPRWLWPRRWHWYRLLK